jgi:putative transposase
MIHRRGLNTQPNLRTSQCPPDDESSGSLPKDAEAPHVVSPPGFRIWSMDIHVHADGLSTRIHDITHPCGQIYRFNDSASISTSANRTANLILPRQHYNRCNMPYCSLFYHIVWSTKYRLPLIEPSWEADLYGYMWGKATALECVPYAINGTPDHTHVMISIPPKLSVATVIGHLKGASSHYVNHNCVSHSSFAWQSEYGVFSISEKALSAIIRYVNMQKQHHAENTWIRSMEYFD